MLWDEFLFTKHPEELIAYLEAGGDIDSEALRQAGPAPNSPCRLRSSSPTTWPPGKRTVGMRQAKSRHRE